MISNIEINLHKRSRDSLFPIKCLKQLAVMIDNVGKTILVSCIPYDGNKSQE